MIVECDFRFEYSIQRGRAWFRFAEVSVSPRAPFPTYSF